MEAWEKNWIDYYQIFEVSIDAPVEEIKKRYHAILREIHPDNENGNEELTALLNEAYGILSDEKKREKYNEAYIKKQYDKVNDTSEAEETSYESAYNDYNEKEKFYSDKLAASTIIKEELKKVKLLIDAINELASLDTLLNIDESTYESLYFNISDKVESFISLMSSYEGIMRRYNLVSEKEFVNKAIEYLSENFNSLSQSYYEEVILIKEKINKNFIEEKYNYINNEIDNTLTGIKKLISEIGTIGISKDQYCLEIGFYHNEYEIIFEEFNKIFDLANKYSVESVLEKQNILKSKLFEIKALLKAPYSEAKQISKIIKMQLQSEELKKQYQELESKLIRIIDIINRYSKNKKVKILIEHSINLIRELIPEDKYSFDSDYSVAEKELDDIKRLLARQNKRLQYLENLDCIMIQEDFNKIIRKVTNASLDSKNVDKLIEKIVFVKTLADGRITDSIENRVNSISYNLNIYLKSFEKLNELLEILQKYECAPITLMDLMEQVDYFTEETRKAYCQHMGFKLGSAFSLGFSVITSAANLYRCFILNTIELPRIISNSLFILLTLLLVGIDKKLSMIYLDAKEEKKKAYNDYSEFFDCYTDYEEYIEKNEGYLINYNKIERKLKKVK